MTAWFFLTPIFYQLERIPQNISFLGIDVWRWVYMLNPMASLVTDYQVHTALRPAAHQTHGFRRRRIGSAAGLRLLAVQDPIRPLQ